MVASSYMSLNGKTRVSMVQIRVAFGVDRLLGIHMLVNDWLIDDEVLGLILNIIVGGGTSLAIYTLWEVNSIKE